jgi:hypothetical protein
VAEGLLFAVVVYFVVCIYCVFLRKVTKAVLLVRMKGWYKDGYLIMSICRIFSRVACFLLQYMV